MNFKNVKKGNFVPVFLIKQKNTTAPSFLSFTIFTLFFSSVIINFPHQSLPVWPSSGHTGPLNSVVKSPPADSISCPTTAPTTPLTPSLGHVWRPLIKELQIRGNTSCDEEHIAARRTEQNISPVERNEGQRHS